MTNDEKRNVALSLLHSDSEANVKAILREHQLWDDPKKWRLYGDRDGNFSVIGNQQTKPPAALVEKIVNAVDARLMKECLTRSIAPDSDAAPRSVRAAVAKFIEGVDLVDEEAGNLRFWSPHRKLEQARQITLAVTGSKPRQAGGTSITIVDRGEGQTPDRMPETFLSIDRENKLRIPFVQGKFNMGGTGALRFCGSDGIQLILTRRCPQIHDAMNSDGNPWGFTIVRRERPSKGIGEVRNSVYRYLAPVGADQHPCHGEVLRFTATSINAVPEGNAAYVRPLEWGSVLKLYEYDMKGFGSHALLPDGLLGRLELMLPDIALPVRVHECRAYRGAADRSYETTLVGLSARLEANRANNLEHGFPTSAAIRVHGEDLVVEIYAFKPRKAATYRSSEGIIFTINGQTHGALSKAFFGRKKVKMSRLRDSLLAVVDCSRLSVGSREDLFMNNREQLSDGELRKAIEAELEEVIREHHGLKELRERRRASEIAERLKDSKPLEDVLGEILRTSPSLTRLFLQGQRLNRPHKMEKGKNGGAFVGRRHPTYFRFAKAPNRNRIQRSAEIGRKCRIKFETDVANDYFTRAAVSGSYEVEVVDSSVEQPKLSHNLVLHDGVAQWSILLPDGAIVGDELTVQYRVADATLLEPFVKFATIKIIGQRARPSGPRRPGIPGGGRGEGDAGRGKDRGIEMPEIFRVREGSKLWHDHEFDRDTGCKVIDEPDLEGVANRGPKYRFYVNISNRCLETDLKNSAEDPAVVEAKFVFASVLVGLGILNDAGRRSEEEAESPEDRVASTTRALAPFLLPMIEYLGALGPDELSVGEVGE